MSAKITDAKNTVDRNGHPMIEFYVGETIVAYVGKRVGMGNRPYTGWCYGIWNGWSCQYNAPTLDDAIKNLLSSSQLAESLDRLS